MIAPDLLEILRCPQTGQRLVPASDELLARYNARLVQEPRPREDLRADAETAMHEPVAFALVTTDLQWLYPVSDDIPLLLVEEGIAL